MSARSRLPRRLGLALLVLVALAFLARAFVGDVYLIGSSSMEPTLMPGERVLVLYDSSPPARFDLVALTLDNEALVKRVVGLPLETVAIELGGDLLIDGKRLPSDAPRPHPILVYDSRRTPLREAFRLGSSTVQPWSERDGLWELDARGISAHEGAGTIGMLRGLHDERFDAAGKPVPGDAPLDVGDAIVECAFRPLAAGGRIVVGLDEQGDSFRFTIEITAEGQGPACISRLCGGDLNSEEVLACGPVPLPLEAWSVLRVSNRDNHLELRLDGRKVLAADYDENRIHPLDANALHRSYGERVRLGGEGAWLQIRDLRVWRDLQYVPPPDAASRRPVTLSSGEYYLLGDQSRHSRDSRDWGPVPASSIFGRPVLVVWPLRAIRWL